MSDLARQGDSPAGLPKSATLARAIEIILRKLVRFCVGKISLVRLQEMVRVIYVEEAEDKLKSENKNKNVPLTKLALITGLDTRTLTRTRNDSGFRKPFHQKISFLRELSPIAAIIDVWGTDPEFLDPDTKKPKMLNLGSGKDSFESLFNKTSGARGITAQSILSRLTESGSIRIHENTGKVELIKQLYLPSHTADKLGLIEVGYAAAGNFLDTIAHNFESTSLEEKFIQRAVWTHQVPGNKLLEYRQAIRNLLEHTESKGKVIVQEFENANAGAAPKTAGFGLYYFEEDDD